jgi:hypothetical protein
MSRRGIAGWAKPARRNPGQRRAAVRFLPTQAIACYWSRNGGDYAAARVCDISASGACLVIRDRLKPGDELTVELINGPHTFLSTRRLQVIRIYQGRGGELIVSGAFDRKLGYDELLPFML